MKFFLVMETGSLRLSTDSLTERVRDDIKDEDYTFSMNSEQVMTIALCDFGINTFSSGIQIANHSNSE